MSDAPIDAATLAELRSVNQDFMLDTCRIQRPEITTVVGVQKHTLVDVAQTVEPPAGHPAGTLPCRFKSRAPQIPAQIQADQVNPRGDYNIVLPYAANVQFDDRITVLGGWYRVVWCAPAAALGVGRTVGVVDSKPEV